MCIRWWCLRRALRCSCIVGKADNDTYVVCWQKVIEAVPSTRSVQSWVKRLTVDSWKSKVFVDRDLNEDVDPLPLACSLFDIPSALGRSYVTA